MWRIVGRAGGVLLALVSAMLLLAHFVGALLPAPLLAYSATHDLYVRDLRYGLTLQLTFDGERYIDSTPAWSPDGRAVVFTRSLGPPYSAEDPDSEVYWMTLDGTRRVRLTDNDVNDDLPAWSPDGTLIAYLSISDNARVVKLIAPEQTEAQAVTLSIALPQRLFTTVKWTPDSDSLLLHALDDNTIYPMIYDRTSEALTRLSSKEAYYPAASPQNEHIAALFPVRGGHALALLTDDPMPRFLTDSMPPRAGVVWEDESHLLYLSEDLKTIMRVNVHTGQTDEAFQFPEHVISFDFLP